MSSNRSRAPSFLAARSRQTETVDGEIPSSYAMSLLEWPIAAARSNMRLAFCQLAHRVDDGLVRTRHDVTSPVAIELIDETPASSDERLPKLGRLEGVVPGAADASAVEARRGISQAREGRGLSGLPHSMLDPSRGIQHHVVVGRRSG